MLIFRYTDVGVETQIVQTGYRLVLLYNLLLGEPGITPSAALLNHAQQDLNGVFDKWEQEGTSYPDLTPKHLVYMLERPLGDSDIRLESIRGKDHLKACHLMTACQTRGFCLFLAMMKYSVAQYLNVGCDDEDHCPCCLQHAKDVHVWDDDEERSCSLLAIVTANGQRIARDVTTNTLSVIQDQVVGLNAEPDEYDLAERTKRGYYQRGLVHVYYRSCIVLVPRPSRFDFLLNGKGPDKMNFDIWIDILLQEIHHESLSVGSKRELKQLCRRIVARTPSMSEEQLHPSSWLLNTLLPLP